MQVLTEVDCRAVVEYLLHPGFCFVAIVVHVDPESLVRQSLLRFQWCDAGCRSRRWCLNCSLQASGCECCRVLLQQASVEGESEMVSSFRRTE